MSTWGAEVFTGEEVLDGLATDGEKWGTASQSR